MDEPRQGPASPEPGKGTAASLVPPRPSVFTFGLDELLLVVVLFVLLAAIQIGMRPTAETSGSHIHIITPRAAVSPDGSLLASNSPNGSGVFDLSTERLLYRLPGDIRDMEFSPDGRWLALVIGERWLELGRASAVQVLDAKDGKKTLEKDLGNQLFLGVRFAPDGSLVWLGHDESDKLRLFSPETGDVGQEIDTGSAGLMDVTFVADGQVLVNSPFQFKLFDIETGKLMREWDGPERAAWVRLIASPGGRWVATVISFWEGENSVYVWDVSTGEASARVEGAYFCEAISSDGRWLVANKAKTLRDVVWHLEGGKGAERLVLPPLPLAAATFLDDDTRLRTVTLDGTITTWDLKTMTPLASRQALFVASGDAAWKGWKGTLGYAGWLVFWILAYRRRRRRPELPTGGRDIGVFLLPIFAAGFVAFQLIVGTAAGPSPTPVEAMSPAWPRAVALALQVLEVVMVVTWAALWLHGRYRSRLVFVVLSAVIVIWLSFCPVAMLA